MAFQLMLAARQTHAVRNWSLTISTEEASHKRSRCLCVSQSAHTFSVKLPTVEKFKHLICGDRRIAADCEDDLPIDGLHRKTDRNAILPQQADSLRNIPRSLWLKYHLSSTSPRYGAVKNSTAMPAVVSVSRAQIVLSEFRLHSSDE